MVTPAGRDTRPTTDRVREATFNALGSLGLVEGARVLDLFAGSGALGIEALSRGASHCTFVDDDRRAVEAVRANLATCDLADRATVVRGDATTFLRSIEDRPGLDLALLDPPYAFDGWAALLGALPVAHAVIESGREPELPVPWVVVRQKRYGTTLVTLARRDPASHLPPDSAPT